MALILLSQQFYPSVNQCCQSHDFIISPSQFGALLKTPGAGVMGLYENLSFHLKKKEFLDPVIAKSSLKMGTLKAHDSEGLTHIF